MLLDSLVSVATAHMSNFGCDNRSVAINRQQRALRSIREALSEDLTITSTPSGDLPRKDGVLAAVLMQTAGVIFAASSSVEVHLNCALHLLLRSNSIFEKPQTFFARLMLQRFAIFDMANSLIRRTPPLTPRNSAIFEPDPDFWDHTYPSFCEMNGCQQVVYCFFAEIVHLTHDLDDLGAKQGDAAASLYETVYDLETRLRHWGQLNGYSISRASHKHVNMAVAAAVETDSPSLQNDYAPPTPHAGSNHKSSQPIRSALQILGECFYWAAHLLLYRRVYRDTTTSARVQTVFRKLVHLMDQLEAGCGPDTCLPIPFYLAAREAATGQDRDWVRRKHASMTAYYRDRSREMMMQNTEEIWQKSDEIMMRHAAAAGVAGKAASQLRSRVTGSAAQEELDAYIETLDWTSSYFIF